LRLTVLGSSCSIPRPGRACSSYLVEGAGRALIFDMGSGSFANLVRFRRAESIDGVIISHMHADHFLDIIPLRYALKYGERNNGRRVALYLPPDGAAMLHRLTTAFTPESTQDFMSEVFDVRTYEPSERLRIGELVVSFAPTSHYIPTFAMRCDGCGSSVAYSADTAPDDRVAALANDAGAFVCEATLTSAEENEAPRGHSSAREAAGMALRGRVRRLVLSHYPATADPAELASQARTTFDGPLDVADDAFRLTV